MRGCEQVTLPRLRFRLRRPKYAARPRRRLRCSGPAGCSSRGVELAKRVFVCTKETKATKFTRSNEINGGRTERKSVKQHGWAALTLNSSRRAKRGQVGPSARITSTSLFHV